MIDRTVRAVREVNKDVPECCDEVRYVSDTVVCRPREDDGGTPWVFTSWGALIASADQVEDAAMYVYTYVSRRPEQARPRVSS
ncbi:hypothetical protein Acsp04_61320 [Actinomadura sp. NBRC 104425]|nr:hypothetical protein Acsp04_61320 [Actinomadura sp. NBRC 104425]